MAPSILIVEDERELADLYAIWLEGYDVATARSGRAAIREGEGGVDLLVLDRELPGMSGGEVVSSLRDRGVEPAVVVASASPPEPDAVGGTADEYLRKPVEADRLRDTVERFVGHPSG